MSGGTQPVATWSLPVNTTMTASAYKAAIDGGFAVAQRFVDQFAPRQTSTPAMTITLDAGSIFNGTTLTEVASQTSGTITAPAASNFRIDRAVIDAATGTLSIVTGTPTTGTPTPPAIPVGKLPVAQISLNSATTTITNATNITDERMPWAIASAYSAYINQQQTWTAGQASQPVTIAYASTINPNYASGNNFYCMLTGNVTLGIPTNPAAGQDGWISLQQDATGSRTGAFAWCYQFTNGNPPTLSTTALTRDDLYYSTKVYATTSSTSLLSIASPCVVTWNNHGLQNGQKVQLSTTGSLPTGLSAATTYFVANVSTNSFNLATSLANAAAGTYINTSGSQSGTQTIVACTVAISAQLAVN